MKLNNTDKKLLIELYHNFREPITKIAKKTKLTRQQVDYKIKQYIKNGVITKFGTIFNYSILNYNYQIFIFIKLKEENSHNELLKQIPKENLISSGEILGKYSLFLTLIFKDENEFNFKFESILNSQIISNFNIVKPIFSKMYPLKFLGEFNNKEIEFTRNENSKFSLDKKDILILKELSKNNRIKLIEISRRTKISSELILYKIKKLKEEKIILGSRIIFDMEKLGFNYSLIKLNIKNLNEENKKIIEKFSKENKYINSLLFQINNPNCIIQVFHKNFNELKNTIENFKKIFENKEFELNILFIEKETPINTLPFLE